MSFTYSCLVLVFAPAVPRFGSFTLPSPTLTPAQTSGSGQTSFPVDCQGLCQTSTVNLSTVNLSCCFNPTRHPALVSRPWTWQWFFNMTHTPKQRKKKIGELELVKI